MQKLYGMSQNKIIQKRDLSMKKSPSKQNENKKSQQNDCSTLTHYNPIPSTF